MNHHPPRLVIYPKDVVLITGRSERTARHILAQIRKKNKKEKGALVTIEEFCHHTGMKHEQIQEFLK